MAEITYLLGAGASYQALPIVSEMAGRIDDSIEWIKTRYQEYRIINRFSTIEAQKFTDVISDLEWLKTICDITKNFSVDTYARKLSLSDNFKEYRKLKNILSFYFTIEQKRRSPDVRYDNFWASILKSKLEFPNNIKIISWNYDFQLELTYQGFIGTDSLKMARKTLNVSSLETNSFADASRFGIFKLNGSATFSSSQVNETNYYIDNFNGIKTDEFIISLVEKYKRVCENEMDINNHLSFAWDHQTTNAFYTNLEKAISGTEILVVLGYSFPFFNRDVDKLILKDYMKKLDKVYFQAPDAEDLRERFLAINNRIDPLKLVLRKDIKQFTLPNEL